MAALAGREPVDEILDLEMLHAVAAQDRGYAFIAVAGDGFAQIRMGQPDAGITDSSRGLDAEGKVDRTSVDIHTIRELQLARDRPVARDQIDTAGH